MSYSNKLTTYQGDCKVLLGRHKKFSDYIQEFAKELNERNKELFGLEIGVGPGGVNSKYFEFQVRVDGCDIELEVLHSIPVGQYNKMFIFDMGKDKLHYKDIKLDFVFCSCVIQHLNSFEELKQAISEISRVLKVEGLFYCMFKSGNNDTTITHFNCYYNEERTFRVFNPEDFENLCKQYSLSVKFKELLMDENWIPYCLCVFEKI